VLSPDESHILTRVGPGTPMGALMREYWLPAARSSEVEADGPPRRLMLLGEKLIAFRDSTGRVGVMDHRCPHRCASLFYGRNVEGGIRCVYHGWKYDVDGNCLETPNLPARQDVCGKVRAKAYKVVERCGLIWVYMGGRARLPAFPALEAANLPADQLNIAFVQRERNWLQALEGDIDTSHFSFLHFGAVRPDDIAENEMTRSIVVERAPEYSVAETDWGLMYAAYRPARPGATYWRIAHLAFPFWTMPPHGPIGDHIWTRAWVPLDDTHTMHVELSWKGRSYALRGRKDGTPVPGIAPTYAYLPDTSDWLGRYRLAANSSNDYMIDRERQRTDIYSGIAGILLQDQAITESMGELVDHGFEFLAPSDGMITRTRRRLLDAARRLAEVGTLPPGVDRPEVYARARGGDYLTEDGVEWIEAYEREFGALSNRVSPIAAE
jgi:phenylpropionate dioxygenase-like ring-hydroxylating dioxygenase large terminal subunit